MRSGVRAPSHVPIAVLLPLMHFRLRAAHSLLSTAPGSFRGGTTCQGEWSVPAGLVRREPAGRGLESDRIFGFSGNDAQQGAFGRGHLSCHSRECPCYSGYMMHDK